MAAFQKSIQLQTRGNTDVIDITPKVLALIHASGVQTGVVNIAGVGSTLGVTTIEFEPGCVSDLRRALDAVAPANDNYAQTSFPSGYDCG